MSSEDDLTKGLQGNDPEIARAAFETMVRLYHRPVYNLAYRFMGDPGGADDVVQETFLKAFHAVQSFRGDSSLKSWLLRIAANTAKNALRSRDRRTMVDVEDVQLGSVHAEFGRLEKAQTGEILRIAIQKLPPKQRQALELRIFEDLPFKEIAEIMDAPFDTAKANFRHAVTNLKKILEATDQGRALDDLKSAFESLTEDEGHEPLG